jgi:serine beta-lactamase-like protein LACTB
MSGWVTFCSFAQTDISEADLAMLLNAAASVYEDERLVGLQAAVFSQNQILGKLNIGYADLEHLVEVSDGTRFEIASLNKTFTSLALLILEGQGQIDLDEAIQKLVPEFPEKPGGIVTPGLLAGGLAGIRHYEENERTPEYYATHYEDVISALEVFKNDALVTVPGKSELYSSYGYVLLAAAIQRASGEKYQDYMLICT